MRDCTCTRRDDVLGLAVDEDCPVHGLPSGVRFPPMDRHALPGEDARATQRRLYLAAAPDHVRVAAAGFVFPIRRCPAREFGQR